MTAQQISGCRPQSEAAIGTVNAVKEIEEHVLRLVDELYEDKELAIDQRWLSIGRTQIEQGFMAVNRSIMKPQRIEIPDEDAPIVETGWVLEREDSPVSAPLYYAPQSGHDPQWSADNRAALRLAREEDAAQLAQALGVKVRVCEHQWG